MEQKDFLMNQIEQLGLILSTLLTKILLLKTTGNELDAEVLVTNELNKELKIDFKVFKTLSKNELKEYLQKLDLKEIHLEKLAEICIEMGSLKVNSAAVNQIYISKALALIEIIDENTNSFSIERNNIKTKLIESLKDFQN